MKKFLFFLAIYLLISHAFAEEQKSLISFEISDQFGRIYTENDLHDRIIICLGGDKDGSQYIGQWSEAIRKSISENNNFKLIKFIPLSDLRGIPFFVKGFVKSKFPKNENNRILMDWDGLFPNAYQFETGECNILIFDRNGVLVHKIHGNKLNDQKLSIILEKLQILLNNDGYTV